MERLQSINPERILWCCADRGISVDQLAAETGVSYSTLDRTIDRESGLTFGQLKKVAAYFGRGVLFFMEPGAPDEYIVHTAQFRTLTNHKPTLSSKIKSIIERSEKQRDVYLELLDELDLEETQKFEPPAIAGRSPPDAAEIVRDWAALGHANSFDSYRTAVEAKGILVFRTNGYNGKWQIPRESPVLGFSLYDQICPLIVVRKQEAEVRQTFTLAHELGHLLLHRASSIDDEGDFRSTEGHEREANLFAAHFLVPDRYLTQIRDNDRPRDVSELDVWLRDNRRSWGVSAEVILLRLLEVGRLDRAVYLGYKAWKEQQTDSGGEGGTRTYRHREPKHLFGDKFVHVVLDALNSRKITIARASRYLDSLKIQDIHQLEHFYAGR